MASNPQETYDALKSLFNSGDVLGNVSDAVKQSYIDRIDRMETEYQKAGASGSFNAGVEGGKLVTDIAGLLAGGAGVAKGGAVLTEKVVAKVAGKAESATAKAGAVVADAGKGNTVDANKVKDNIATSQKGNESSNFGKYLTKEEQVFANKAQQELISEINKFPSKNQAGKNATMVGAYDPVTGKTAIGNSNANITAEALHPKTVTYIEKQLGVKIGEFTSFCKNKAGACAEVSAADQLIRQGANPSKIKFTEALRPRDVWGKDHIPSDAIIPPCNNCNITWPKGK